MKKLSIKKKLALWYTLATVLILCIFFALAIGTMSPALLQNSRKLVETEAAGIAEQIELEGHELALDKVDIRSGTYYSVYDRVGILVMHNHEQWWLDALENPAGDILSTEHNGESWIVYDRFLYEDGNQIGRLRVAMPVSAASEAAWQLFWIFLIILPGSILLSGGVGILVAHKALKPVTTITQAAKDISKGDVSKRLNFEDTGDEVSQLAVTFDEMLASLQAALEREKQFTNDASHELRTPLSVIIALSEEAIAMPNASSQDYKTAMLTVYQKGRDMQAMLAQMLELARLFEGKEAMELAPVNVSWLVEDVAAESREKAAKRDMQIHVEKEEDILVQGDMMLLTRALINLVDNAISYGENGGWIKLSAHKHEDHVTLQVQDNGEGISEKDKEHIFDRFYRADSGRANTSSTGMGLAFVRQIAILHGAQVQVNSEEGKGTAFILSLPLSQKSSVTND